MNFFGNLFGDKDLDSIDSRISNVINALPPVNRFQQTDNISGDFIDAFLKEAPQHEIQRLLENVSVARDRLDRYNVYDEAYRYVPIIKRMMSVYISNILQKNPVTGKSLLIKDAEDVTGSKNKDKQHADTLDKSKKLAENFIKAFDMIKKLRKKILPNMLQYGDCYAEVIDIGAEASKKTDQMGTSSAFSSVILESELQNSLNDMEQLSNRKMTGASLDFSKVEKAIEKIARCVVEYEEIVPVMNSDQAEAISDHAEDEHLFDNILLKIHKPHHIIVLETTYGSLLGYLVVAKDEIPQHLNLTQSLATLVGRITTIVDKDQMSQEMFVDKLVRYVIKTVLQKSNKDSKISSAENLDQLLKGLEPNVYKYVVRLFIEQGILQKGMYSNRLKIRFVPATRMIPFTVPSSEFDPYGGSFIESLVFPCKLYIISQLSNVIVKLSRAAPVRKWSIDIGQTQMQAGLIQKLKRELYNTRITLDDLASFKSIPKILSDFKDMFILTKQGQRPIDVEIQAQGDPTVRVADLEDARREIMSLSGIPPAYLGYADVIELREQLVHTNVAFATEISDIQETVSAGMTRFLDIIAEINELGFVPSEYISVGLIPPIVLMLQLIEMTLSSIGNISGVFQTLQIPSDPYFLLEKYIPYIDWNSFKAKAEEYQSKIKTETDINTGANIDAGGGEFVPSPGQ